MICPALISWRWWGTADKLFSKNEHDNLATFLCHKFEVWGGLTWFDYTSHCTSQFGYKDFLCTSPPKKHMLEACFKLPFGSGPTPRPQSLSWGAGDGDADQPTIVSHWWALTSSVFHQRILEIVSIFLDEEKKHRKENAKQTEGWMVFVVFFFFSLFLLTGFLVSPGMVRIGVGRFFWEEGVDQCEGQNLSRTPRFYPGSFEPVAKREDDPLGTYFCS